MGYGTSRTVIPVTIPSGQSLSAEINVDAKTITGIAMPAAWDAASITFVALVRQTNAIPPVATFGKVQDPSGAEVTLTTPAADAYIAIPDTAALHALGRIKIRSGTAATPVAQTADRVLYLIVSDD